MQGFGIRNRNQRSFRAGLEDLESRQCLSVTVTSIAAEDGTRLKIEGDAGANTINVVDRGDGHVSVTNGNGKLLASADNVSVIRADLKGGADVFNYVLENPLAHQQKVFLDLGAGADEASFDYGAGVTNASLRVEVTGGAGADKIDAIIGDLVAAQAVFLLNGGDGADEISIVGDGTQISADSRLRAQIFGEQGKDNLTASFTGQIQGILNYSTDGGKGIDKVVTNITATEESSGTLRAKSSGRQGVDEVTLNVIDNSAAEASLLAELKAKLIDRPGTDLVTYTDNVTLVTGPLVPELPETPESLG
jgi:hypothetical protein